jgi:hypothetical protein
MAQRTRDKMRSIIAKRQAGACVILAAVMFCAVGCSSGQPYDIVKVSGTVKFDDGSLIPAERIMLKFVPQAAPIDAKTHPRKGMAEVNVGDGTFDSATTHKPGDGIIAGKHLVLVGAYEKGGKFLNLANPPIEIDTHNLPLEIRVKKPHKPT